MSSSASSRGWSSDVGALGAARRRVGEHEVEAELGRLALLLLAEISVRQMDRHVVRVKVERRTEDDELLLQTLLLGAEEVLLTKVSLEVVVVIEVLEAVVGTGKQ